MAKRPPAPMRAVATFCVGVRTINVGEVFPTDDELVTDHPALFEPAALAAAGDAPTGTTT